MKYILVAILLSLSSSAIAESIGMFKGVKGQVYQNGETVTQNDDVYRNATIETSSGAYAVIHFKDGGKMVLRPDTKVTIEYYENDGMITDVFKGGLRAVTGAIADRDPDSYKVKTPTATLGVRGTEFYLRLCDAKMLDCEDEPQIKMYEGN